MVARRFSTAAAALLLVSVVTVIYVCMREDSRDVDAVFQDVQTNGFRRLQQATRPAASLSSSSSVGLNRNSSRSSSSSSSSSQQLCTWSHSDSSCHPTHQAWTLVASGMPSSHYRRAVLAASAREDHCQQHRTAGACERDVKKRCMWSGTANSTDAKCGSSDLQELLVWTGKGFPVNLTTIPHAMTCPGTPARTFFECYAYAGTLEACTAQPQCFVLETLGSMKYLCIPKVWQQMKFGQLRLLLSHLESFDPAGYGTCGATCWLRQARHCSSIPTKDACQAVKYCVFDDDVARNAKAGSLAQVSEDSSNLDVSNPEADARSRGSRFVLASWLKAKPCKHNSKEFTSGSPVDQAAQKAYAKCHSAKTPAACMGVSSHGIVGSAAASASARFDTWKNYEPTATPVDCPMQSTRGL